jgi:hypothetical protein
MPSEPNKSSNTPPRAPSTSKTPPAEAAPWAQFGGGGGGFARPGTVRPGTGQVGAGGGAASPFGAALAGFTQSGRAAAAGAARRQQAPVAPTPPPMPPAKPIKAVVSLFPNTGHHYYFQRFERVPGDGGWRVPSDLENLCRLPAEAQWHDDPERPWLLYKFATLGSANGILLAIESNIGDKERGFVLDAYNPENEPDMPEDESLRGAYPFSDFAQTVKTVFSIDLAALVRSHTKQTELTPATFHVGWATAAATAPRNVHLVVDFGNSRSLALLLEEDADSTSVPLDDFKGRCFPLQFKEIGAPLDAVPNRKSIVLDSWLLLRKTSFEDNYRNVEKEVYVERAKKSLFGNARTVYRRSKKIRQHCFVELSPAATSSSNENDSAAQLLFRDEMGKLGSNISLSSPKRYTWSTESRSSFWNVSIGSDAGVLTELPELSGPIRDFMDVDGRDWELPKRGPDGSEVLPEAALLSPDKRGTAARPSTLDPPIYPLADALTWMDLGIIERAYAQINSEVHRRASGQLFIERRLASVQITFPSGWTDTELSTYRSKWQKAINIFALSRLPEPSISTVERDVLDATALHEEGITPYQHRAADRPVLAAEPDEAIASQIPFIVSDIQHLGGKPEEWIQLMGKSSPEGEPADHVRVLNLDIGGGTSDVAIVDYSLGGALGVSINSKPILKFSSNDAGDEIVRLAIENVLLPFWISRAPKMASALQNFIGSNTVGCGVLDVEKSRAVRLIFQPIINYWLGKISGNAPDIGNAAPFEDGVWDDFGHRLEEPQIGLPPGIFPFVAAEEVERYESEDNADEENADADKSEAAESRLSRYQTWWRWESLASLESPAGVSWKTVLEKCVTEIAARLLPLVSLQCAKFDVDLVLVSGKPSELPPFVEEIGRGLPVSLESIRFAKGYPVGLWYPYQRNLTIDDAKTVTVVGAALYRAFHKGLISGWSFNSEPIGVENVRNDWSILDTGAGTSLLGFGGKNLLFEATVVGEGTDEIEKEGVLIGSHIGARRPDAVDVPPNCVYCIGWKNDQRPQGTNTTHVNVKLRRVIKTKDSNTSEGLELVSVTEMRSGRDLANYVTLRLKTLLTNNFWMDSPLFAIRS